MKKVTITIEGKFATRFQEQFARDSLMGILKGLFNIVDDIVSIPTDILGITNTYGKKKAMQIATQGFIDGKITLQQYQQLVLEIEES